MRDELHFEPDQPSGWSAPEYAAFVVGRAWRAARTMQDNPHEYALRTQHDLAFDAAVRYIRENGAVEYFKGRPYKTLYFGEHKFWTMGAALEETVLINRKLRSADGPGDPRGDIERLELTVMWDGPFSRDEVIGRFNDEGKPPDYDGADYGLYQIYGRHILCGADTLLYIGRATGQTFARRFRQHNDWLIREDETSVYLGHIYDPQRHSADDLWASWETDVKLAECAMIYKYSPNYNSVSVSDPPPLGNDHSVELVHEGNRHKLQRRDSVPSDW